MSDLIVYVDGYNLFHGLRHKFLDDRYQWLDLVSLAQRLRPRDNLIKVNYYTAPLQGASSAVRRQQDYLGALRAVGGKVLAVHEARYQPKTITCKCGRAWRSYEEKETDVHLAVDLVADIATRSADSALVVSGDSDLCPAVRRAREFNAAAHIAMAFPPKRVSTELRALCPRSFVIGPGRIKDAQLPDRVEDPATGRVYERPVGWRPATAGLSSTVPASRKEAPQPHGHPC
ncbi:hypothetical protein BLA24_18145 [Streptomyces cinnamoneus]|uniref:NYN domain-containing protein n=1 Tax=Streptomyces cinnamoneus TaxID=53446 RepID=A0A2G1XHL0_STRCJ|nr:NYN domain-containing protein [Streptomyces cinnamoneus]PHQ50707.1 hypothetical protein BLA24_18145 [Streptomyces cinnamoneus]PPT14039.1 NYN domain-containing protein [Streptomyces cinnamoneus]